MSYSVDCCWIVLFLFINSLLFCKFVIFNDLFIEFKFCFVKFKLLFELKFLFVTFCLFIKLLLNLFIFSVLFVDVIDFNVSLFNKIKFWYFVKLLFICFVVFDDDAGDATRFTKARFNKIDEFKGEEEAFFNFFFVFIDFIDCDSVNVCKFFLFLLTPK